MQTANRLEGIGEYYFSQKLREIEGLNREGKNIINLGIGSPDLPPHKEVIDVLIRESGRDSTHAYQSYKGSPVLRGAISEWYKKWYNVPLNPDTEILPLIGSKEGILHICMTYLNKGEGALIPNPGYPTYKSAVMLAGGTPVEYILQEEKEWFPDMEELEKRVAGPQKIKLLFVNYPQMPTGKLPAGALFEELIHLASKHGILIVHDNPYSFILNDNPQSILGIEGAMDTAVELNSLSKSHNMAGWRVGMLCGAAERINEVLRFKSNMDSGMFLPLQLAAAKALTLGRDWHDHLNTVYAQRRKVATQLLDALNCTYSPNQAGLFIWAKIPNGYKDGYALSDKVLYASNVFITPGGIFGSAGTGYVRVSLCSPQEKINEALQRILS